MYRDGDITIHMYTCSVLTPHQQQCIKVYSHCHAICWNHWENFPGTVWKTYTHFQVTQETAHITALKLFFFVTYQAWLCKLGLGLFQAISGNSEIPENSENCREIFSGEIPGNFPSDFPAFSGDTTHATALILSF